jgi:protein CMS1
MSKKGTEASDSAASKKRKSVDDRDISSKRAKNSSSEDFATDNSTAKPTTPQKRPTSEPAQSRQITLDDSLAVKDPALLSDFFAQKVAKHYKDSTTIEQQDLSIARSWLRDTTDFNEPHSADNLAAYLLKFMPDDILSSSRSKTATPHTLVIASSGIRVADLARALRSLNSDETKVAKLIAKHMKLKENVEYLAKTKVGIAVGTPARLKDLVDQDAIKTTELKAVVIDASYLDEKKRGIADMAELFKAMLQLLHHKSIRSRLELDNGARILVF